MLNRLCVKHEDDLVAISPTTEIIEECRLGRMVILIDDENRENEGDLVIPACHAGAREIAFMARHGCGLICLTLTRARAAQFDLKPMSQRNTEAMHTAFTVSVDAKHGITTGISASDRAQTIRTVLCEKGGPADLVSPGHLFPLVAEDAGVLGRRGHTEASVDLARLAGLPEAAVICEIMREDGEMARLPDLMRFANEHGLKIGTIDDLAAYRCRNIRSNPSGSTRPDVCEFRKRAL